MEQRSVPNQETGLRGATALRVAGLCGLAVLVVACFGPALFAGRQFAFRDAGHYYYPLHLRIQQQWRAGLLPLWEPAEDGGVPLLGSPQAAVLYPGKVIYALLPYAWAARIYVVAHILLGFAAMRTMLRSWRVSGAGATIAGFSYAFGAPVLFQYGNVIYLVGAAWAPLGFRAADAWLRLGRRWGVIQLAIVLAMQALGGDIQAAYLTTLCAAAYAIGLASSRASAWKWGIAIVVVLIAWFLAALGLGPKLVLIRSRPVQLLLSLAWAIVATAWIVGGWRDRDRRVMGHKLLGLGAAGTLAIGLGAIQFVPVAHNLATSARWNNQSILGVETFSLEPYRLAELIWPNVFGSTLAGDRHWLLALPPIGGHRIWIASLYLGALPLVLAMARPVSGKALRGEAGSRRSPWWASRPRRASSPIPRPGWAGWPKGAASTGSWRPSCPDSGASASPAS